MFIELFKKTIRKHRLKKAMSKHTQKAIYLKTSSKEKQGTTTHSFFGGMPHLPKDFRWPVNPDTKLPLHFLGQINCSEMPQLEGIINLPTHGVLFYFADIDEGLEGLCEEDRACSKVIYVEKMSGVSLREKPKNLPMLAHSGNKLDGCYALKHNALPVHFLEPCVIDTYDGWEIYQELEGSWVGFSEEEAEESYNSSIQKCLGQSLDYYRHMIFGVKSQHPNTSSGEGIKIMQIDGIDGKIFDWDEFCVIDFWISRDDLAAKRFDRAYGLATF